MPPKDIQKIFMGFFAPIIEKIDLAAEEEKTLVILRDALLPKILSGEMALDKMKGAVEAVA